MFDFSTVENQEIADKVFQEAKDFCHCVILACRELQGQKKM